MLWDRIIDPIFRLLANTDPTSGISYLIRFVFIGIILVILIFSLVVGSVMFFWLLSQIPLLLLRMLFGSITRGGGDIKPFVDVLFFPGIFLRHLAMVIAARILGYDTDVGFYLSYGGERSVIKFTDDLRHTNHALIIGMAPYFNGILSFLLGLTIRYWIQVFPERIHLHVFFAYLYLSFSISYRGMPSLESVWFFIHALISRTPWPVMLTLWGLFATSIMISLMGFEVAIVMFFFYEIAVLYYELVFIREPETEDRVVDDVPVLLPLDSDGPYF